MGVTELGGAGLGEREHESEAEAEAEDLGGVADRAGPSAGGDAAHVRAEPHRPGPAAALFAPPSSARPRGY
ncbi:hypothetical protein [Streptomyces sp. FH025]|uniref:hypothetical protein n=1 Tax=Streptomyces sp. FH025 TaxID=2815937 RepID=UPI001A9D393F|nr:hypothetical protein [Streptomyces sp. FH025]MBO1417747.1 hypothetical protein [Streptomyces sp. FH025]